MGESQRRRPLALAVFVLVLWTSVGHAGTARILVVGDSWAAGIFGFRAFDAVLTAHGLDDIEIIGRTTALSGTRADQWAVNHKGCLDALTRALAKHPSIDIVHVSVGGNDFLKAVLDENVCALPPDQREPIWERICTDIERLLRHILAQRPDIHVLLNGYDYLDPELMKSVLSTPIPVGVTRRTMNEAFVELARLEFERVKNLGRVEFIQHFGLLQYHYGHPPEFEKDTTPLPGGPPDYDPFLGGNPDYPNPVEAMPDGVHPTPEGYSYVVERCFRTFYADWLGVKAPTVAPPVSETRN